jgi:hypothetical protein
VHDIWWRHTRKALEQSNVLHVVFNGYLVHFCFNSSVAFYSSDQFRFVLEEDASSIDPDVMELITTAE